MGAQLGASAAFLIFKLVFVFLIREGSVAYNQELYYSLGISVEPGEADAGEFVRTFASDVCSIVVSLLLFIGCIIRKNRKSDLDETNLETLKVTGSRSPRFWICVSIVVIGLAGIISPSLISFLYISK